MKKSAVVVAGILALCLAASAAVTIKVKVAAANVRLQPTTEAAVVGRLTLGTVVEASKKVGGWYEVTIQDAAGKAATGYVFGDLVEVVAGGAAAEPVEAVSEDEGEPEEDAAAAEDEGGSGDSRAGGFVIMASPLIAHWSFEAESGVTRKDPVSFSGGFGYEIPVAGGLSVLPEVVFSLDGAQAENALLRVRYRMTTLALPLLLRYNFGGPFLEAGPYGALVLTPKVKLTLVPTGDSVEDDVKTFRSLIFGLSFGAGYELRLESMSLVFQGVYRLGLSNLYEATAEPMKTNAFGLLVGVKL